MDSVIEMPRLGTAAGTLESCPLELDTQDGPDEAAEYRARFLFCRGA